MTMKSLSDLSTRISGKQPNSHFHSTSSPKKVTLSEIESVLVLNH